MTNYKVKTDFILLFPLSKVIVLASLLTLGATDDENNRENTISSAIYASFDFSENASYK